MPQLLLTLKAYHLLSSLHIQPSLPLHQLLKVLQFQAQMMARLQEHSASDLEKKIHGDNDAKKLKEILTISSQEAESLAQIVVANYGSFLRQHGSNFTVEQPVIDPESLVQPVTGNHASSIYQYGSNLTEVRVPTRATKLTLDFFREIITILIICYPDLFMMLIYGLEEGWNYGSIFLPVLYIAFNVALNQKAKVSKLSSEGIHVDNELKGATVVEGHCHMRVMAVGENPRLSEMMSSTGSCTINHKSQLQIKVDRLASIMKKAAVAFFSVTSVVLLLYHYFEGNSATANGGNNDGHAPKGKKATMAELLREAERIIKKQGGSASRFIGLSSVVLVSIRGGLPTGVLISLLCAKKKMEVAGHRILNLEACATIGFVDTVCINTETLKEEITDIPKIVDDIKHVVGVAIHSGILNDEEHENRVVNTGLMDLKRKCKEVAVADDSTRDSPLLEEAAVGLFMGNRTPQVPQEGTDIVLADNSLTAIADVLKLGRFSFNNIKKFVQLHLTITIAGLVINFLAAISTRNIFLSQFQIWWVSLMGDTLGAFALSTDPPSSASPPSPPSLGASSLTTNTMWRNIGFQALYQATMSLALYFIATAIIHVDETEVSAMIFNSYALCQVFVLLNAREIEKKNVFENMHKNLWFLLVVVFMVVLQVTFTCFNPKLSLDLLKWTICIGFSALSLPIGWVVKYIPVPASP